jgi:hypothetical protein
MASGRGHRRAMCMKVESFLLLCRHDLSPPSAILPKWTCCLLEDYRADEEARRPRSDPKEQVWTVEDQASHTFGRK